MYPHFCIAAPRPLADTKTSAHLLSVRTSQVQQMVSTQHTSLRATPALSQVTLYRGKAARRSRLDSMRARCSLMDRPITHSMLVPLEQQEVGVYVYRYLLSAPSCLTLLAFLLFSSLPILLTPCSLFICLLFSLSSINCSVHTSWSVSASRPRLKI